MSKRNVEVFTAGCYLCDQAVSLVVELACDSCDVEVVVVSEAGERRARELGITAVPAVAVDGELCDCCEGVGVSRETLEAAGIGKPTA